MDQLRRDTPGRIVRAEPSPLADQSAREVIGAAIEVHRILGPGLLERTYETALAHELGLRSVPFKEQVPLSLGYKGVPVGSYVIDMIIANVLIVELKSVSAISEAHVAQTLAYLAATQLELGLILNFGEATLRSGIRRVVRTATKPDHTR